MVHTPPERGAPKALRGAAVAVESAPGRRRRAVNFSHSTSWFGLQVCRNRIVTMRATRLTDPIEQVGLFRCTLF